LTMVPGAVPLENATVLIAEGRIAALASSNEIDIPSGYTVIEGAGHYLLPGFTDMHMHFLSEDIAELEITAEDILTPYLAHGVLQVVDLAATVASNDIRDRVENGTAIAPFLA